MLLGNSELRTEFGLEEIERYVRAGNFVIFNPDHLRAYPIIITENTSLTKTTFEKIIQTMNRAGGRLARIRKEV